MLFVLLTIFTGLFFYDELVNEIYNSVIRCFNVIVPSLYGSMIIACLITESRFHILIGKIFSLPARYIFKMRPEIFAVFLISNISGYPTGAKLLKNIYQNGEISKEEFSRYCCICYSAGPAFITGTAAVHYTGFLSTGVIIFFSCLVSNLILAVISGKNHSTPQSTHDKTKCTVSCSSVIRSADCAARGMVQMCTIITAFSVFKVLLICSGAVEIISALITRVTPMNIDDCSAAMLSLTEITNISEFCSFNSFNLPVMSALFSTGGLCVIMQIFAITGDDINRKKFLLYRLIGAVFSGVICNIICRIFLKDAAAPVSSFMLHSPDQPALPSLLLIIMSIMLISTEKRAVR